MTQKKSKTQVLNKNIADSYKALSSRSFARFSLYLLMAGALIFEHTSKAKSLPNYESAVQLYGILSILVLANYGVGILIFILKPQSKFLITTPWVFALALLFSTIIIRLNLHVVINSFLRTSSVNDLEPTLTLSVALAQINVSLHPLTINVMQNMKQKFNSTSAKQADFVEEYYFNVNQNDASTQKAMRLNLLVQFLPILPFIALKISPIVNEVPAWIVYAYSITYGLWSFVWLFTLGSSVMVDDKSKTRVSARFMKILRYIDLSLGFTVTILLTVMVLYKLGFVALINDLLQLYLPSISASLSKLISQVINWIVSGVVGNWAYDKLKNIRTGTKSSDEIGRRKKKKPSMSKTG